MKRVYLYNIGMLALLLAAMLLGSCMSDKGKGNEWILVWEENFDGNEIDTTVWSKILRGGSDWDNYMSSHDTLFNVADGNLILRGIVNTILPNDTAPYLTGGVYSKGKKTFGLGKLEIRAKLNGAQGAWPAFWMLPESGPYPDGGEIDIMEHLSFDDFVFHTVHSHYTLNLEEKIPNQGGRSPINLEGYNIYTLESYQDSLVFYVNDNSSERFMYPRIETDKEGQFPFADHEFFLLLDMQLGGSWVGVVNPDDLPVDMAIDWVRFYEKQE